MMKTLIAALAITGSLIAAQAAAAATYSFSFSGAAMSGVFTTASAGGTPLITSITGSLNGNSISLLPTGTAPSPTNDNLLFTAKNGTGYEGGSAGYLDAGGIEFLSAGADYNLFYDNSSTTMGYDLVKNTGTGSVSTGNLTIVAGAVSAAPEPGAWALMLGGVGMLGGLLRVMQARRREDIATA